MVKTPDGPTMTVGELREKLAAYPDDMLVLLDTTVIMGNYEKPLPLSLIDDEDENEILLTTMPG